MENTAIQQLPNAPAIDQDDLVEEVRKEKKNSEQIRDFVRKLGFVDEEKKGGDQIRHFLQLNQVSHFVMLLTVTFFVCFYRLYPSYLGFI